MIELLFYSLSPCPSPVWGCVIIQKSAVILVVMPELIRHPVAERSESTLDSLRGEYIEPRVKPGMTNQQ